MAGNIFVLNGGEITELHEALYENEDLFQSLIERYPNILAGEQINPEAPRKWVLIAREMGVPSEMNGSDKWSLDHLFADQDAVPTFVEVKRSADTRIRREVVAQMLDYAANGTAYWPIDKIRLSFEKTDGSLAVFGIMPDEEEAYWKQFEENLRAGKIRLLFVADSIPMELRRIIEFLNVQMKDAEVLGVEIKRYTSDGAISTLVPRIVGQTAITIGTKSTGKAKKVKWDEDGFITQTAELGGSENAELCRRLIRAFESLGCYIWWGEGKDHGGFVPVYVGKQRHQLCSIYNWYQRTLVEIYFQHMKPPFTESEYRQKLKASLERIPGVNIPGERIEKRPNFELNLLSDEKSFCLFIDTMKSYIEDIKVNELEITGE
ncbi:MAG: hypothetical protein LBP95_14650 [Deltaproteobacteria bacterium]|jgi:hypothetical protein|nr:hypothetical protein [Deltaproteobacteria bacterium]